MYSKEESERIQSFIQLQIGKAADSMDTSAKIKLLQGKFKRMLILMIVNLGIVIFFGYSFYYEITQLNKIFFNLILLFFGLNVVFLGLQWKKLKKAINWLKHSES